MGRFEIFPKTKVCDTIQHRLTNDNLLYIILLILYITEGVSFVDFLSFYAYVETKVDNFYSRITPSPLTAIFLEENRKRIVEHTIMKIFYDYYKQHSPRKSLRKNMQSDKELESTCKINKDNSDYNRYLYNFKKYAQEKDAIKKVQNHNSEKIPIDIFNIEDNMSGHHISDSTYKELKNITEYQIFDIIQTKRITNIKRLSNNAFEEAMNPLLSQNSDLYYNILNNYENDEHRYFKLCIDLFALEINCHFEMNYIIAQKLKKIKSKTEREKERESFGNIYHFIIKNNNMSYRFQNFLVKDLDKFFSVYDYPKFTADKIYNLFLISNYIISCVSRHIQNANVMDDDFLFPDNDDFFENFIGKGQHIQEKTLNDINLRDFRALF